MTRARRAAPQERGGGPRRPFPARVVGAAGAWLRAARRSPPARLPGVAKGRAGGGPAPGLTAAPGGSRGRGPAFPSFPGARGGGAEAGLGPGVALCSLRPAFPQPRGAAGAACCRCGFPDSSSRRSRGGAVSPRRPGRRPGRTLSSSAGAEGETLGSWGRPRPRRWPWPIPRGRQREVRGRCQRLRSTAPCPPGTSSPQRPGWRVEAVPLSEAGWGPPFQPWAPLGEGPGRGVCRCPPGHRGGKWAQVGVWSTQCLRPRAWEG